MYILGEIKNFNKLFDKNFKIQSVQNFVLIVLTQYIFLV